MNLWGMTNRGAVRRQNQDAYAQKILPDGRMIAVVCDGMGGAKAGNIASELAVQVFMEELCRQLQQGEKDIKTCMEFAASCANDAVYRRASTDMECEGMGTTMVAALIWKGGAVLLNEGDSRAYHIAERSGIARITRDHSLVEDLVLRGELTPEQAKSHPHKNYITRAVGAEPQLKADFYECVVGDEDYLLLCSDGLSNVVTEQEILYEVIHGGEPSTCCQRLLDIALHRGAPDNVTALLVQC